jgi:hypothetical protein
MIVVSTITTILCCNYFLEFGISSLVYIFWFKNVIFFLLYKIVTIYKKDELFYFYNLGINKTSLLLYTYSYEIFSFSALFSTTILLKKCIN